MRYASVCDGIGAAHVAWQPLGWECAWTSEIEPFPAAVVEHRFGFPNVGDMTKITEEMLDGYGPVDLLVGGCPCQSFSVAGLRGGLADPRGNLSLRFCQLAAVMRPRWVVFENVPGLLSSGQGRDFGTFLGALAELGYGFAYRILDAQWWGVAQRRRRVFVVCHLGDWRRAAAVLFERESVFGNPPTRGAKGQRVTGAAESGPGGGLVWRGGDQANSEHCIDHAGTLNCDKGQQGGIVAFTKSKRAQSTTDDETWVPGEVSPTMSCFDQGDTRATTVVAFTQNSRDEVRQINGDGQIAGALSADAGMHQTNYVAYDVHGTLATKGASQTDCHTALRSRPPGQSEASTTTVVAVDLQNVQVGGDLAGTLDTTRPSRGGGQAVAQGFTYSGYSNQPAWMTGDRTDCLPASGHSDGSHQGVGVMAFRENQRGEVQYVDPPHALASGGGKPGQGYCGVQQAMAVRRLTPRECERLQGFPDDYTLVEYRKKPAADGPRYRALGNSMAVPVMRWIGERIKMVDELRYSP